MRAIARAEAHLPDPAPPWFTASVAWQLAFWVSYAGWAGVEAGIALRDRRTVRGQRADRGSRWLIIVVIGACLWAAFALAWQRRRPWLPAPSLLLPVGLTAVWAGIGLRLWAVRTLGTHFRTSVIVQQGHELIERGPYARVRNPSYSGSLLTLLGIGLSMGTLPSLLVLVLGPLLAYLWRIRVEEQALARHFGARYAPYRARTWALIPWLW